MQEFSRSPIWQTLCSGNHTYCYTTVQLQLQKRCMQDDPPGAGVQTCLIYIWFAHGIHEDIPMCSSTCQHGCPLMPGSQCCVVTAPSTCTFPMALGHNRLRIIHPDHPRVDSLQPELFGVADLRPGVAVSGNHDPPLPQQPGALVAARLQ